jgi:hypothetical protein
LVELKREMRGEVAPEKPWPELGGSGDWSPEILEAPLDVLPESMAKFAREVAESVGCDASYVLGPMLAIAGGLIGSSARLRIGPTWLASATVLQANLGSPGMGKGRALAYVAEPVLALGCGDPKEATPIPPAVEDGTVWAWEDLLEDARPRGGQRPVRGLLVVSKDLARHGLDADAGRARRDRARLMSLWEESPATLGQGEGEALPSGSKNGREGGARESAVSRRARRYLLRPQISITGNVTPSMLREMKNAKRDDRFLDRWLFACADRRPKLRGDERAEVSAEALRGWSSIVQRLWERTQAINDGLSAGGVGRGRGRRPKILVFDEAGKAAFDEGRDRHAQELNRGRFDDKYRGTWARLETYAGRFWLILTLLQHLADRVEVGRGAVESGQSAVGSGQGKDEGGRMKDGSERSGRSEIPEGESRMTNGKCQMADERGQPEGDRGQTARLCATPMASKEAAVGAWRLVEFFKSHAMRMQYALERSKYQYGTPRGASLVLRWITRRPELKTVNFRDLTRHYPSHKGYDHGMLMEGAIWLENRNALRPVARGGDDPAQKLGRPRGKEWEIHPVFLGEGMRDEG